MSVTAVPTTQWSPALPDLLAPVSVGDFVEQYWERHPLFLRHEHSRWHQDVLSLEQLDRLISGGIVDRRDGRIVRDGITDSTLPLFHADGRANVAMVYTAYADGHTLVVNNVHQRRAEVAWLCRDIERTLGQTVGANAYLTPRGAQGLAPHFDNHDVFIIQCEGSKDWRIHERAIELPMMDQHFDVPAERVGKLLHEFRLHSGDVLYLPRGYVHVTSTTDTHSLHLTLGISTYRLYDAVAKALWRRACENVELRRSTPPLIESRAAWRARLGQAIRELAADFAAAVDIEGTVQDVESDLIGRLHAVPDESGLEALNHLDGITVLTRVRKRRGTLCCVIEDGDAAVLQFPGNALSAPRGASEALRFVEAAEEFSVAELPDSLTADAKVNLTRRLVAMGLLFAC